MSDVTVEFEMLDSPSERMSEGCNIVAIVDTDKHTLVSIKYKDDSVADWVDSWGPDGTGEYWLNLNADAIMQKHIDEGGDAWYEYQEYIE